MALIATLFGTAILYLLQNAEFVALAQVMVYIGGVVIFAVFTILLTTNLGEKEMAVSNGRKGFAALLSGGLAWLFIRLMLSTEGLGGAAQDGYATAATIGTRMLRFDSEGFIVPFEVISVLLLAAMIGAVVLARKDKNPTEEGDS
jgi:NADH-quinone oxidoreductase subunit J